MDVLNNVYKIRGGIILASLEYYFIIKHKNLVQHQSNYILILKRLFSDEQNDNDEDNKVNDDVDEKCDEEKEVSIYSGQQPRGPLAELYK